MKGKTPTERIRNYNTGDWDWSDDSKYTKAQLDELKDLIFSTNLARASVARGDKAFDAYRSLTGEAESRLVQRRLDMTPEQRKAEPPWVTLEKMLTDEGLLKPGQKAEDVLISRGGSGVSMQAATAGADPADANITRSAPPPIAPLRQREEDRRFKTRDGGVVKSKPPGAFWPNPQDDYRQRNNKPAPLHWLRSRGQT